MNEETDVVWRLQRGCSGLEFRSRSLGSQRGRLHELETEIEMNDTIAVIVRDSRWPPYPPTATPKIFGTSVPNT